MAERESSDAMNSRGATPNLLRLVESEHQLVEAAVAMQLNITLPSQVRETRAVLAMYGHSLARHTEEQLGNLFIDPVESECLDVDGNVKAMGWRVSGVYEAMLTKRNQESFIRRTADTMRVSKAARVLGRSGILLTASGTSAATGYMVHEAYNHTTPAIIALGAGFVVGRSIVPTIVRNSTHRVLGKHFDNFLNPVTDETWNEYELQRTEQILAGGNDFTTAERAKKVREIEIAAHIQELEDGLGNVAWQWWLNNQPPLKPDQRQGAQQLSQMTVNHLGHILGVMNDHDPIPVVLD